VEEEYIVCVCVYAGVERGVAGGTQVGGGEKWYFRATIEKPLDDEEQHDDALAGPPHRRHHAGRGQIGVVGPLDFVGG